MFRRLAQVGAAISLAVASLPASAAPTRLPTPVEGESEQIVGLLWQYVLLPVIIAAVLVAVTGEDDDAPTSP